MDRRGFLRGLFAAPAIVAASSLMPINSRLLFDGPPMLWGDGIHDDTAALQWMIDNAARDSHINLGSKIYRLTGTVTAGKPIHLSGGTLHLNHGDVGFVIHDGSSVTNTRVHSTPPTNIIMKNRHMLRVVS